MVCGASVAGPTAQTARVSSVIAFTSMTTRMVHGRRCPMCSSFALERFGRYTAPSHSRTVSSCAIAKSFPSIPSSSPISATIKIHFMARVPRVTVSLALPRHSSARPSTEHNRPVPGQFAFYPTQLPGSSGQDRHPGSPVDQETDPVPLDPPREVESIPHHHRLLCRRTLPGPRVYCDGGNCQIPERPSAVLVGHSLAKCPFWWHE